MSLACVAGGLGRMDRATSILGGCRLLPLCSLGGATLLVGGRGLRLGRLLFMLAWGHFGGLRTYFLGTDLPHHFVLVSLISWSDGVDAYTAQLPRPVPMSRIC